MPPTPEFEIHRIFLSTTAPYTERTELVVRGPSVLLVVSGYGTALFSSASAAADKHEDELVLEHGVVELLSDGSHVQLFLDESLCSSLLVFVAGCSSSIF